LYDLAQGKEILRINCPQAAIGKLEDNLVCFASVSEISLVDLRKHDNKVWSLDLQLYTTDYMLKKIQFDEHKCILGTTKELAFINSQTGNILYKKGKQKRIKFGGFNIHLSTLQQTKRLIKFSFFEI